MKYLTKAGREFIAEAEFGETNREGLAKADRRRAISRAAAAAAAEAPSRIATRGRPPSSRVLPGGSTIRDWQGGYQRRPGIPRNISSLQYRGSAGRGDRY
tara:strand:- start:266 stop:565 length:300 start_codon:yes stop_codon:yes gene_type:complete